MQARIVFIINLERNWNIK